MQAGYGCHNFPWHRLTTDLHPCSLRHRPCTDIIGIRWIYCAYHVHHYGMCFTPATGHWQKHKLESKHLCCGALLRGLPPRQLPTMADPSPLFYLALATCRALET